MPTVHHETLLSHAGYEADDATGAVVPPIHLATTFERSEPDASEGYVYSRLSNPNREQFETLVARLEGGGRGFGFASGMAAISAVFQLVAPPAHVVMPEDIYYGVRKLVIDHFQSIGLRFTFVSTDEPGEVERALQPDTRLIWIETPSNPLVRVTDIRAVTEIARARGIPVAVDGTWTTPLLQRPLELGADIVLHSATKYLAGHSDVIGGVVVLPQTSQFADRLRSLQQIGGAVLSPFSSWMALRGMRTLALRLKCQCDNAESIARFLDDHPRVAEVHYPGLISHPGHEVAKQQMSRFGAMLSFQVEGRASDAIEVVRRCRVFRAATSLGGVESLIEHRASVEQMSTVPQNLIRVSVGTENISDLMEDLSQSLAL